MFRFQTGAIKSEKDFKIIDTTNTKFRFQTGAIKSW